MYLPKKDIYEKLNTLDATVMQYQPTVFNNLPVITFKINDNTPNLFLDNTIAYQNIEVQIDIWANDSVSASNLLSQVEETMREDFYQMTYSADVPNVGDIYHIVTRFRKNN